MKLEQLSTTQIAGLSPHTLVVLPVASIEQHGPHLPTGTDSMIAEGLVEALDHACAGRLLILPTQRFGCSEHHMAFKGTLTLAHDVFLQSVVQVIDAMIRHGFHHFLIINAHGGNRAIGGVVAEQASSRWPEAQVVFTSWWQVAGEQLRPLVEGAYPSVGHACEFETSLMLVFQPQLVDMSQAKDDGLPPAPSMLRGDLLGGGSATWALPFHKLSHQGPFGRPTLATVQKGQRIVQITVEAYRRLIEACWPGTLGAKS